MHTGQHDGWLNDGKKEQIIDKPNRRLPAQMLNVNCTLSHPKQVASLETHHRNYIGPNVRSVDDLDANGSAHTITKYKTRAELTNSVPI